MNKILTIVIPTYNMEKYLDRCLTSLVLEDKELMKKLEVLVVIDGAKDRSSEIAHSYEAKHPETIRVIDKENGNYGSCINRGLKEAAGKYFKILDADDYYDKDSLSSYLKELGDIDCDVVLTGFNIVDEFGSVSSKVVIPNDKKGKIYNLDEVTLTETIPENVIAMHAVTVKRDVLLNNNYYQQQGISYTDTEYTFFSLLHSSNVYLSQNCLYQYFVGRDGQTVSLEAKIKHSKDFNLILCRLLTVLGEKKDNLSKNKESDLIYIIMVMLRMYISISILAVPSSKVEEKELKNVLSLCKSCGINVEVLKKQIKYHGIPFFSLWTNHNISIYPLYKLAQKLRS